jgi:hypothetical protein
MACTLDGNGTCDSNLLKPIKYELNPRRKGTFDFPGKVAGGFVFF